MRSKWVALVAFTILLELGIPISPIRLRSTAADLAAVSMPKASMHEDDLSMFHQHDVWLSWQIVAVEPITVSPAMNQRSHNSLRLRIARTNARHVVRAACRRDVWRCHFRINWDRSDRSPFGDASAASVIRRRWSREWRRSKLKNSTFAEFPSTVTATRG